MAGGTEEIPTLSGEVHVLIILMEQLLRVVVRAGVMPNPEALQFLDAYLQTCRHPRLRNDPSVHPLTHEVIEERWQQLRDSIASNLDVPWHAAELPRAPQG